MKHHFTYCVLLTTFGVIEQNQAKNQFENLFNEEYDKRTSPPLVNEGTVHTIK